MKLVIDNKIFENFESYDIKLVFNAIASSFSFRGLSEFLPEKLTYPECRIYDDFDDLIITGNAISQKKSISSQPTLTDVSGYSKAGILEDVNYPIDLYPMQFDNLSLRDITKKITSYFGIDYSADARAMLNFYKPFKKTNIEPEQNIKSFLNSLASQRQITVSNDERGNIRFRRPYVPEMQATEVSIIDADLAIDGQAMFSHINVLKHGGSGQITIRNPYVNSKYKRTKTRVLTAGDDLDVEDAAWQVLRQNLRNIKLKINSQNYLRPGQLIRFQNAELDINKPADFFVESVNIKGSAQGESYTYTCVLADVYGENKTIKNIFLI